MYYHQLLEQCMKMLQEMLRKRERHEEIVSICGKLLTVSQEETWYSYQIQAYLDMKKTDMAYRTYEQAVRILVDQLKHPPSQELMNLFSSLNKRVDKSLETIKEIREILYDEIEAGKAYYCSFPSFIDAYRLAGRLMQRNGQSSFLILCTITDERGNAIENHKKLEKISEQFQETLITSLRSSDLVTRYNMSQYLLLLNGIVREDCSLVTTRIERNFRKKGISGNYYINYYISSVLDKPPLSMMTESHYYQVHHAEKLYEEMIRQAKPEETETKPMETLELEIETPQYVSPIDFESLWEINPDVVGWIQIDGTQIDYPILYDEEDNEKYLHTDIEGNDSVSGAIYLDADDTPDFTSLHNVIYGHHMKNGNMFKDVVKYKEQDFFDAHRDITIYLPEEEIQLKAFACTYTEPDGIRRKTQFKTQEEFQAYVKGMTENADISEEPEYPVEQLFSLVTCSYEFQNARTILYCYPVSDTLQETKVFLEKVSEHSGN